MPMRGAILFLFHPALTCRAEIFRSSGAACGNSLSRLLTLKLVCLENAEALRDPKNKSICKIPRSTFTGTGHDRLGWAGCGPWQANLDHQATLRPVGGAHCATMQAHGALGNGQTEADAASLASAGVVNAVERPEQLVERILGHAWTRISDSNDGFRAARTLPGFEADLHSGTLLRVAGRIAHHIFDRAV